MADSVENPATGERVTFVSSSAQLLVMETVWPRPGHRAPEHLHPGMEERWTVLSGRARFRIGGDEVEAGPGDTVVAPPGMPHLAWNPTGAEVRLRIEMRPPLRWRELVERLFAGESPAALLREFPRELALPPPPAR
jgi:quercetin dioxygenase-like cupin family protein